MKSIGAQTGAVVERRRTSGPRPLSSEGSPPSSLSLRTDSEGQKALAVMLQQCFQTLRVYGKEPEALESVIAMFRLVLADYPMDNVTEAFQVWLKRSNEMPTPADIANIIERGGKPPLERAVYVAIGKRDPVTRTSEEWAYMREFEAAAIAGDSTERLAG